MQPEEPLPTWVDTFGYDPQWTWVLEEASEIQVVAITYPVFGKLFLLRLQANQLKDLNWVFPFSQQMAKDCMARGIEEFYLFHEDSDRVGVIFERKGFQVSGSIRITQGSWRGW